MANIPKMAKRLKFDKPVVDRSDLNAAERAFAVSGSLPDLSRLEAAERAYYQALSEAEAMWKALTIPQRIRDSAEINAFETEGTDNDPLRWHLMALGSVECLLHG